MEYVNFVVQHRSALLPILDQVITWLRDQEILPSIDPDEARQFVYNRLQSLRSFQKVVQTAINETLESALKILHIIKDEVIKFFKKDVNKFLMAELPKLAVKVVPREVIIRCGIKQAIKYGVAEAGQQVVQRALKFSNPASIVADLAQTGMEVAGYAEAGKGVGMIGNIGTGLATGAVVAGPAGAAVGALAGFLTWGVGEVTSGVIYRVLS
ncbi:uncharacterized protein [Dysidea avara]|uniref:uncharacterized protein n=1 Tax=Dysidea avara TaxID=196820 RepID=UPI0033240B9C